MTTGFQILYYVIKNKLLKLTNNMNTLLPNFSAEHQVQNFKAISKRTGVEVLEVNYDANLIDSKGQVCFAGRTAYIKVGDKKALIYLALSSFVINNVIDKMFKNAK